MADQYENSDASEPEKISKRKLRQLTLKNAKTPDVATASSPLPSVLTSSPEATESEPADDPTTEPSVVSCWHHDKQPSMTSPIEVTYCPTCGFPPDFCEFGPNWETCSEFALSPKYRHFYTHYLVENNLPVNDDSSTTDAKKVQPKQIDKAAVQVKKGKKPVVQQVTIQRVSRAKHKMATVIIGLDLFGIKLDAAAKFFKKRFACGSSAVKGLPGQHDHVEIQGDFEDEIDQIIVQNYPQIPEDAIIHLRPK